MIELHDKKFLIPDKDLINKKLEWIDKAYLYQHKVSNHTIKKGL